MIFGASISPEKLFAMSVIGVLLIVGLALLFAKRPKKLNIQDYTKKWREIQALCKDKKTWPMAILGADALLSEVLKKRKINGKTTGERLVSAQKLFSNHDSVWQAHKLRNRIAHGEQKTVKENEVKKALIAIRQALRDIGAL